MSNGNGQVTDPVKQTYLHLRQQNIKNFPSTQKEWLEQIANNEKAAQNTFNYLSNLNIKNFPQDVESWKAQLGIKKKTVPSQDTGDPSGLGLQETESSEKLPEDATLEELLQTDIIPPEQEKVSEDSLIQITDTQEGDVTSRVKITEPIIKPKQTEDKDKSLVNILGEPAEIPQKAQNIMNAVSQSFYGLPADVGDFLAQATYGIDLALEKTGAIEKAPEGPEETPVGKLSKQYREVLEDVAPVTKESEKELETAVARGVGQVLGLIISGGTAGAGKLTFKGIEGLPKSTAIKQVADDILRFSISRTSQLASMQMASHGFKRAKEQGATDEEAFKKWMADFAIGKTEALPIAAMFGRMNKYTQGGVVRWLKNVGTGSVQEAVQETVQEYLSNLAEKEIYNEGKNLFDNIFRAGQVGGITGAIINGFMAALPGNSTGARRQLRQYVQDQQKENQEIVEDKAEKASKEVVEKVDPVIKEPVAAEDQVIPEQESPVEEVIEEVPRETEEEVSERDIARFAERIQKGEKIETPEDIQFYENNKEKIEQELQQRQAQEKPVEEVPRETEVSEQEFLDIAVNTNLFERTGSPYDIRVDLGMRKEEINRAIKAHKEGKKSKALDNLKTKIKDIHKSGTIPMIQGSGGQTTRTDVPINEYVESVREAEEKTTDELVEQTPDYLIEEAEKQGITKDNIDEFKDLFNGFPFEQQEFEQLKSYLNEKAKTDQPDIETETTDQSVEETTIEPEETVSEPIEEKGQKVNFEFYDGTFHEGQIVERTPDNQLKIKGDNNITYTVPEENLLTQEEFQHKKEAAKKVSSQTVEDVENQVKKIINKEKPKDISTKKANITINPLVPLFKALNLSQSYLTNAKHWLENHIARATQKGLKHNNSVIRNSSAALQNLLGGLAHTEQEAKFKRQFVGNKNNGNLQAKIFNDSMYEIINDQQELTEMHMALDPVPFFPKTDPEGNIIEGGLSPDQQVVEAYRNYKDLYSQLYDINAAIKKGETKELNELKKNLKNQIAENKKIIEKYEKGLFESLTDKQKEVFNTIKEINDFTHSWYYKNGLLDVTTYEKNKGRYIGRFYEDYELETNFDEEMKRAYVQNRADLSMFTQRQDQEQVTKKLLSDPVYATSKRLAQMLQTQAVFDYAKQIEADPNITILDHKAPGFTHLAAIKPRKGEKAKPNYGVLTNKFVPNFIAEDFKGFFFANHIMQNFYDGVRGYDRLFLRQIAKKGYTVYSPLTRMGNIMSNFTFAFWAGIDPVTYFKNRAAAKKEFNEKGPAYQELVKEGIIGADVLTIDMVPLDIRKAKDKRKNSSATISMPDNIRDAYNKAVDAVTATKMSKWLKGADSWFVSTYAKADDIAKLTAYKSLTEDYQMNKEEAKEQVYSGFQNYSTVGKFFDFAAKTPIVGNPYIKFKADLARILKNLVITRPLTAALWYGMMVWLKNLFSDLSEERDEVQKARERRNFIPKIKTPMGDLPMVWQTPVGEVNFARYMSPYYLYDKGDKDHWLNYTSEWFPYQWQMIEGTTKGTEIPFPEFNDVLLGPYFQLMIDRDFRGKSIRDPEGSIYRGEADTREQIMNSIEYIARSHIPFFKRIDDMYAAYTGDEDYYGRVRTLDQAILNNIIKIQEFNEPEVVKSLQKEIEYKVNKFESIGRDISAQRNDTMRDIKDIMDNPRMSDELKKKKVKKEIERFNRKLAELLKQQEEVVKDIEEPSRLLKDIIVK